MFCLEDESSSLRTLMRLRSALCSTNLNARLAAMADNLHSTFGIGHGSASYNSALIDEMTTCVTFLSPTVFLHMRWRHFIQ